MSRESKKMIKLNHIFFFQKSFVVLSVIDKMLEAGDNDNKARV